MLLQCRGTRSPPRRTGLGWLGWAVGWLRASGFGFLLLLGFRLDFGLIWFDSGLDSA